MRKIPSYETYIKAYTAKQAQLAKKGYSMYDTAFSASEYVEQYTALKNKQLAQVAAGQRKGAANILRDLVNDQAYATTRGQALSLKKAGEQLGVKMKLSDIMTDPSKISNIISEQRRLLIESGLSSKEASLVISQEYFGSE